jgi:hypothetical protein
MSRQDQYARESEGIDTLHCCFACAAAIGINGSADMQQAKTHN